MLKGKNCWYNVAIWRDQEARPAGPRRPSPALSNSIIIEYACASDHKPAHVRCWPIRSLHCRFLVVWVPTGSFVILCSQFLMKHRCWTV